MSVCAGGVGRGTEVVLQIMASGISTLKKCGVGGGECGSRIGERFFLVWTIVNTHGFRVYWVCARGGCARPH